MPTVKVICLSNVNMFSCLFDPACSLTLQIADNVSLVSGSGGEWQTTSVNKTVDSSNRAYLLVTKLFTHNPLTLTKK